MRTRARFLLLALSGWAILGKADAARAGNEPLVAPPSATIPPLLTLKEALRMFREGGLDLLIADAAVLSAEGDVQTASGVFNPTVSFGMGPAFNYSTNISPPPPPPCSGCARYAVTWSVTDSNAIEDFLVGKRGLRVDAARAALASAKLGRTNAARTLETQLKTQYVQVALNKALLDFARQVQASMSRTLELNQLRYPGVIDEGALARVEIQKLEADQAVASAEMSLRQAQAGLAFLLGVRTDVPSFEVERSVLDYRPLPAIDAETENALVDRAFQNRPDLKAIEYQKRRADLSLQLAELQRFPDFALGLSYSQEGTGQNAITPPTLIFGLSLALPVFYQQQGEIRRARADRDTQELQYAKVRAQVLSDVSSGLAGYRTAKELVERMERTLLSRAKLARDIVEFQFKKGAASLTDFLDAQRTYVATNVEYRQDLAAYWTAIFLIEQAASLEFNP